MAKYDRTKGTTSEPSDADARTERPMRLEWSALFGGTLIGWGVMLVLALVGMTLGLSVIDPFTARPAVSDAGAAIWGAVSAVLSSFVGGFAVVRLAGDRRRDASVMHGAVSWGMSMLLAGLIALFVAGVAAFTRTPVRNTAVAKNTRGQTGALVATTGNGPVIAIFATGGAVLALAGSLLGSLAAASRSSGVPFSDELRLQRRGANAHAATQTLAPSSAEVRRDETTILPPTH
jgi:amino acid permease